MRILFTIYQHLGGGGAETSTLNLARALSTLGHDILFASTEPCAGFTTHVLPPFRVPVFQLYHRKIMRTLARLVEKERVDIIHSQDRLTTVGAIMAGSRMGVPVVAHFRDQWFCCPRSVCVTEDFHQYDLCSYGTIWRHFPKRRLLFDWYKWFTIKQSWKWLRRADAKIAVSRLSERKLRLIGAGDNLHVVHNSRDIGRFAHLPRGTFRKDPDEVIVAFVGSLTYIRGVMNLAKVAVETARRNGNVRFLVVGDGNLRQQMVDYVCGKGARERFVFAGKIDNDRIQEVYGDTDVLVFPSMLEEPFSGTLVEAMASGIPIVASRYGGNLEAVDEGKNGFLIDPHDLEEFAGKLELLVRDERLRASMSRHALEKAIQFGNEVSAEKVSRIYAGLRPGA